MARASSIDVARWAGVSPTTVSLVLNDRHDIAIPETTRQRVRQAAAELDYRPNLLAKNLLRGRTQTLGVVAPRLDSSFCGQILQGIQETCMAADYRLLLTHTLGDPQVELRQVELLLDHQVEGILSITDDGTLAELPQRIDAIVHRGVPCIVVDDESLHEQVDCLVSDDVAGARKAVEHLIRLGHRRIAHLAGGSVASSGRARATGYREALAAAGIEPKPQWEAGESFKKSGGGPAMARLLDLPERPTAVFAANDELAAEAWRALRQLGLHVPEDIALVGYADFEVSEYLELTTVQQDARQMGRRATERLLERIADPSLPRERLVTPTRLVVRKTCGARSLPGNQQNS